MKYDHRLKAIEEKQKARPARPAPAGDSSGGQENGYSRSNVSRLDFGRLSKAEIDTWAKWHNYAGWNCGVKQVRKAIEFKAELPESEWSGQATLHGRWIAGELEAITHEGKLQDLLQIIWSDAIQDSLNYPGQVSEIELEFLKDNPPADYSAGFNEKVIAERLDLGMPRPGQFSRRFLLALAKLELLPAETRDFYTLLVEALDRNKYLYREHSQGYCFCSPGLDLDESFLMCQHPIEAARPADLPLVEPE